MSTSLSTTLLTRMQCEEVSQIMLMDTDTFIFAHVRMHVLTMCVLHVHTCTVTVHACTCISLYKGAHSRIAEMVEWT